MTDIKLLYEYARRRYEEADRVVMPNVFSMDCEITEKLLDECELYIKPDDAFMPGVSVTKEKKELALITKLKYKSRIDKEGLRQGHDAFAFTARSDFGHTSAEWESVISLGIHGLRSRVVDYSTRYGTDGGRGEFYAGLIRVIDAALRFMGRCAAFAREEGKLGMAQSLEALCQGAPTDLYGAMQTSILYYNLQHFFDGTDLRTMGRVDGLFLPFYLKEEPGRAHRLVEDYLIALNSFRATANIPFALGGTDEDGRSLFCDLSELFLETYRRLRLPHIKLHLLCHKGTPSSVLRTAMASVREGGNSIVFLSDERVVESLERLGAEHADAARYHVVGCYECGADGELTCSCNARVNLPKALEYAVNGGVDMISGKQVGLPVARIPQSFEELMEEYRRQLIHLCRGAMRSTDIWEEHNGEFHAAPILSATYASALERGGDLYCENTAKYNNSSVNALGLATAADSLAAVKELVFDEGLMTLTELVEVLKSDWQGQEALRLRCKHRCPKFGTGNPIADKIAREIVDILASTVNGAPNAKGGVFRLGLFSIDWRWKFGKKTAATADGRRRGEPLSQNTGATFGADKAGATAHLRSVASIDTLSTPNGAILDLDFHSSAVRGEDGLGALVASALGYFDLGGFAVHYNVLDSEVLRDAVKDPDKYPDLQVRLCGWNVLFSTLSDREKAEFIARCEKG